MNKVYAVITSWWGTREIHGVFSSKEKAAAYIKDRHTHALTVSPKEIADRWKDVEVSEIEVE